MTRQLDKLANGQEVKVLRRSSWREESAGCDIDESQATNPDAANVAVARQRVVVDAATAAHKALQAPQ